MRTREKVSTPAAKNIKPKTISHGRSTGEPVAASEDVAAPVLPVLALAAVVPLNPTAALVVVVVPDVVVVVVLDDVVGIVRPRAEVTKRTEQVARQPCRGLHPHEPIAVRAIREDLVDQLLVEGLRPAEVALVRKPRRELE